MMEVKSNVVKNNIALEPGMLGPWTKARVNIGILGIGELKWMGMDEFNSDDYYIYYCMQESLRRHGVALIVNKRVWNAVLGCNLKNDRRILFRCQGKPFIITVIQVCTLTSDAEEAEIDRFCEDPQELLEQTPKKKKKSFSSQGTGMQKEEVKRYLE